jgi:hypothetical protein
MPLNERMRKTRFHSFMIISVYMVLLFAPQVCHALCATVKIEIRQELTLERQAFDAHMRINNGLSNIPIENVGVTVDFWDEDGNPVLATSDQNNTSAAFFIRIDSMDKIENVTGSGRVAPETSADIHWLIIPAPGASNGLESGKLYYVGATLNYTAGGLSESIEVTPDYIFVKPMPQLVLDYFMPTDVYGDDAWTPRVEPPVPFTLGLRIKNKGHGHARAMKVESAQPRIVENDLGLLIGFQIDGSTVNGRPATESLLADFGDIAPNRACSARWLMSCTLSGRFVDFEAEFSHADELGGKLTSLIAEDDVRTHFLVRDVLVDADGRDGIPDYLARDEDVFRVYESDGTETLVTDQSAGAVIAPAGNSQRLTIPPTAGFAFARVSDLYSGNMLIKEAIRSDGKRIKPENIWCYKTRAGSGPWEHYLGLFDFNTPGVYNVVFQSAASVPQPPVIMYIPERTRVEGVQLSFLVEASDPNGTIPSLRAERLPIGASFSDQGNGSGIFDWTAASGQAGRYVIRFIASDGELESSRTAVILIRSENDTDGDGMPDDWEMAHFGTLDRDGTGDFDGDGISDLDEFLNGLDPKTAQSVPSVPVIVTPSSGARVASPVPGLQIINSIDPEGDILTYSFEVYSDAAFNNLTCSGSVSPQAGTTTTWSVPQNLEDNTDHYWRVKAADATGSSIWAYGHFFVDTGNDPPTAPRASFPSDGAAMDTNQPVLEIDNSSDPDKDALTYIFEVYTDSGMADPIARAEGIPAGPHGYTAWGLDLPLEEGAWYYWRAVAVDGRGAQTAGALVSFRVESSNAAPPAPSIAAPAPGLEIGNHSVDLIVLKVEDPDGDPVQYIFEIDTVNTFTGDAKITSPPLTLSEDSAGWTVENLKENTRYFWRVKASDGAAESAWTRGHFFVNLINEKPGRPVVKNPGQDAWVDTLQPLLSCHAVEDPDRDELSYRFELYADQELTRPLAYDLVAEPTWRRVPVINAGTWYYWRVQALDEHGVAGDWSQIGKFFAKVNGVNLPPQINIISPQGDIVTNAQGIVIHWADSDPDSNALIAFYHDSAGSGADGTLIVEGIEEDPHGTADYYTWNISALEGIFYLYAVIADEISSETVYADSRIVIDRTSPSVGAAPAGGSYTQPLTIALAADEPASIYYTLDGSKPTLGATLYQAAIALSQATTLKFMAVDAAGNQSATVTENYFFGTDSLDVSVSTSKGRPLGGLRVYAYTAVGVYTGRSAITDGAGMARFSAADFAAGTYKFRADHLGQRFWSPDVSLPGVVAAAVMIPEESVTVTVRTAAGPAAGVRVYLFSASGSYLGIYLVTDEQGQVIFDLPEGFEFTFRADLFGSQYWSGPIFVNAGGNNHMDMDTGGGRLRVQVRKEIDTPIPGVRAYLFNAAGSYLGQNAYTTDNGEIYFDVPAGSYKIRTDYLGHQFWSGETEVAADTETAVEIVHQPVRITVATSFQDSAEPLAGARVYLYSAAGAYMGIWLQTDGEGLTIFELPEKAYKVRVDHLGQRYWSNEFTWQDEVVTLPMADARVTVTGGGSPLPGVRVYLFSGAGTYLGRYISTDTQGQATFRLPEGDCKFRADYQGSQFWSAVQALAADELHEVGISTGGGRFTFQLLSGADQPLAGVLCRVFNLDDRYLGLSGATDEEGEVGFDLADGTYKVRADYLDYQFWSPPVQVPLELQAHMLIEHAPVEVTVSTRAGTVPDARVYLFTESGAYQNRSVQTDPQGKALFSLPAGARYAFRANLMRNQYWSDPVAVHPDVTTEVAIDAGGGQLVLTVQDGAGNPLAGARAYLFSDSDISLGVNRVAGEEGRIVFDLPEGSYKLRVDYLGYSYWTESVDLAADTELSLFIEHRNTTVHVKGEFQSAETPLEGVRIYLFTPTGSYLGQNSTSDADGQATFYLPAQSYMARADYLGNQYWSDSFVDQDATITIAMAEARVSVTGAGLPREGIRVYLFSENGASLGRNATTDSAAQALFQVPAGIYRFRAAYQGSQFWSGDQLLAPDEVNPVLISVGGGTFTLSVNRAAAEPLEGVRCYVFASAGNYLGLSGPTDSQGKASFDLADGTMRFRVDYLGYQYWSQDVVVPETLETAVLIPHQDVTITLSGVYNGERTPLNGRRIHLFTPENRSLGRYSTSDAEGRAVLSLPDQEYKMRADYLGLHYWSPVLRSQNGEIDVAMGAAELHLRRAGADLAGVRVYLFSTAGSYLGSYLVTDGGGWVNFIVPAGDYRFRIDALGVQHWTEDVHVSPDMITPLDVELD